MRRPFMAAPLSSTTYVRLTCGPRTWMREPNGRTRGSAATIPRCTWVPVAVVLRRQYAVAVIVIGRGGRRPAASADGGSAKRIAIAAAASEAEAFVSKGASAVDRGKKSANAGCRVRPGEMHPLERQRS